MSSRLKILLIFPPVTRPEDFSAKKVRISPFPPLGLACIASVLEQEGSFELKILDALIEGDMNGRESDNHKIRYGLSDAEIINYIKEYSPDLVGVSCIFSAMEWDALNVCSLAKLVNKQIIIVLGGPNAGANGKTILEKSVDCDFVVIGEGEYSFKELLLAIKDKQSDFSKNDGLVYRENGQVCVNAKQKYIENLDSLPMPARHLLPMEKYLESAVAHSSYKNKPFTPILSSRGCPAKCTFCAIANHWGQVQRTRSPKHVLDEMEYLIKTYGIREIHFEDDNLTADKQRALGIFNGMIDRGFNISWTVPSGMAVYSLDEELLAKMKESGCYSVSLAIENGNQEIVSKIMRKPVNLKKVPPLAGMIRELGMEVKGFFILGYPGETKQTMEDTINFARQLELDWAYFFIFSPLPGTEIYDTCIEKGYMKESDFDPLRSFYQPAIKTPEFDQDYLVDLRERAIIDVNFTNNANLRKYDVDKAIASFQSVVNLYPHFDFANYYLGEAYLRRGLPDQARVCFQKTLELNPAYPDAAKRLAELEKGIK
jgi:anaerobic magnesium-protoporphyrin IX monomethyl ester cyclase